MERLFPTVPAWWILARLTSLIVGAVLIASAAGRPLPLHLIRRRGVDRPEPATSRVHAALGIATAQAIVGLAAAHLNRPLQIAYFGLLFVPVAILCSERARQTCSDAFRRWDRKTAVALGSVLVLWCVWRIPAALHSPRAATPVDTWLNFKWLLETLAGNNNLLTSTSQPGLSNTYLIFMGLPLLHAGVPPSLTLVQLIHVLWLLAAALGTALLAAVVVGRAAAIVAVATLLFSPLVLMVQLCPAPFGIPLLIAVALALTTWRIYADPSVAGLAFFGLLAGLSASNPYVAHLAVAGCIAVALRALRRPRLPWQGLAIAAATFFAAAYPALPSIETIRAMTEEYARTNWQWAAAEPIFLGQRSPYRPPGIFALTRAGQGQPQDVLLGGLLMPFAVPRTGLRLVGDVLFEPIGAALSAVGLAVCLRRPWRRGTAAMLSFYALALLPAIATRATDRVSMTRAIAVPIALALLAAIGFESTRRALLRRRRAFVASAATVIATLVAGGVLFTTITPHVIPASAMEIILQSTGNIRDRSQVMVLAPEDPDGWRHVERVATYVPWHPLNTWMFPWGKSVLPPDTTPLPELFVWGPAAEEQAQVSRQICARWPQARLYVLEDAAQLSRAFAASPNRVPWMPALPPARWHTGDCDVLVGDLYGRY